MNQSLCDGLLALVHFLYFAGSLLQWWWFCDCLLCCSLICVWADLHIDTVMPYTRIKFGIQLFARWIVLYIRLINLIRQWVIVIDVSRRHHLVAFFPARWTNTHNHAHTHVFQFSAASTVTVSRVTMKRSLITFNCNCLSSFSPWWPFSLSFWCDMKSISLKTTTL